MFLQVKGVRALLLPLVIFREWSLLPEEGDDESIGRYNLSPAGLMSTIYTSTCSLINLKIAQRK